MSAGEFVFNPVQIHEHTPRPTGTTVKAVTPPECDFCLDARVRWWYECGEFVLPAIGFGSKDGWAACDRCAEMIDAGDRPGLSDRSWRSWILRGNQPAASALMSIRAIQAGFFDHREGERRAFG